MSLLILLGVNLLQWHPFVRFDCIGNSATMNFTFHFMKMWLQVWWLNCSLGASVWCKNLFYASSTARLQHYRIWLASILKLNLIAQINFAFVSSFNLISHLYTNQHLTRTLHCLIVCSWLAYSVVIEMLTIVLRNFCILSFTAGRPERKPWKLISGFTPMHVMFVYYLLRTKICHATSLEKAFALIVSARMWLSIC